MRNVAYFYLAGRDRLRGGAGRRAPRGRAHAEAEGSGVAPTPGPTLVIELARQAKFKRLELAVRIAPAESADEADRVAQRLTRTVAPPAAA